MESVPETWRPVPGYPTYEASDRGRVRGLRRGKVLKGIPHRGYLVVKLGHPNKAYGVHQVIAWAFHGEQPANFVVNHINGDKHDNRPENLEYVTNSENVFHAYRHGLMRNHGEWHGNTKVTDKQVEEIRRRAKSEQFVRIARDYDITATQVSRIVKGLCRRRVT